MSLIYTITIFLSVTGSFPIALLSRVIKSIFLRKILHLSIGLLICSLLYGYQFLYIVILDFLIWIILHFPGSLCLIGLPFPLLSLFIVHWNRLNVSNDWKSDISGLIMFTTLRIWMIIFNIFDGRKKEVKRETWKSVLLLKIPNLFDYYCYLFNFVGLFSGPVIPFKIFIEFFEIKYKNKLIDDIKISIKPWIICFLYGIFYGLIMKYFPAKFITTTYFIESSIYLKLILTLIYSYGRLSRYIFAWMGSESAFKILGSLELKNFDPEKCKSFDHYKYFNVNHLGELVFEWNRSVHYFLKEFVHVRILSIGGNQFIARFCTFLFSAYWHGFFPVYYFYAIHMFFMSYIDNYRYKLTSPLIENFFGKKISHIFDSSWVLIFNYLTGACWDLYWLKPTINFIKLLKFIPYIFEILLILSGLIFKFLNKKKKLN